MKSPHRLLATTALALGTLLLNILIHASMKDTIAKFIKGFPSYYSQ